MIAIKVAQYGCNVSFQTDYKGPNCNHRKFAFARFVQNKSHVTLGRILKFIARIFGPFWKILRLYTAHFETEIAIIFIPHRCFYCNNI